MTASDRIALFAGCIAAAGSAARHDPQEMPNETDVLDYALRLYAEALPHAEKIAEEKP